MTPSKSLSEGLYKIMLSAYPQKFQDEYGDQMFLLFQDLYLDTTNSNKTIDKFYLWVKVIPDYFESITKEYLSNINGGDYYMNKQFNTAGLVFWISAGIAIFPLILILSMTIASITGIGVESQGSWLLFIPLLVFSLIFSQWLVLKKYTDRAKSWLLNTAIAWFVMIGGTFFIVSQIIGERTVTNTETLMLIQIIQAIIYGGVLGYFQQRALKGFRYAWSLIPANIAGILMIWIGIGDSISSTTDMMLIGASPAVFTGLALLLILGKQNVDKHIKPMRIAQ